MNSDTTAAGVAKREREQLLAGWAGLAVCGLVAAILWFFAINSMMGSSGVETSALECSSTYGIDAAADCARP